MKDLTNGKSSRLIFLFAMPMLLGNIFQQLYNVVDSFVVGNYIGEAALAAVGASFPVIYVLIALIVGISMGGTIIISQYFGAKDYVNVKKTVDTLFQNAGRSLQKVPNTKAMSYSLVNEEGNLD